MLSHPFCRERRKESAPRGGEIEAARCRALALQQELEGVAGGLETLAGFVFREQAVVDGAFACVVDLVGDAGEIGIDAGEFQVVVDFVEQVAQGRGVAIAGADEARDLRGELLLDGFFEDRAAHDGAGGKEAVKVAACGFIEVAVGFFRGERGDDTLAELGGARDGRLDELKKLEGKGGAEQVVLLGIEGALNFLPGWCGSAYLLEAGERGEALAGMLDEALAHLEGEFSPIGDERGGILAVAGTQLLIDDGGKDAAQFSESIGAGELGDCLAEVASGCGGSREELLLDMGNVDGHGVRRFLHQGRTDAERVAQEVEGFCCAGTGLERG